jgi:hypothetical protein
MLPMASAEPCSSAMTFCFFRFSKTALDRLNQVAILDDLQSSQWSVVESPPVATDGVASADFENRIVASGGRHTRDDELCCEPFDGTYEYPVLDGF